MKSYVRACSGKNVSTQDFIKICETKYGHSLRWFFEEWLYTSGRPKYNQELSCIKSGKWYLIKIHISQLQTGDVLKMPVDLRIRFENGDEKNVTVWNTRKEQDFLIEAVERPEGVKLDPENWILK